jgi:hypothetical protein
MSESILTREKEKLYARNAPLLIRQGDVLLRKVAHLPKRSKEIQDCILARGETTGHSHRIVGARVYKSPANRTLLVVDEEASLVHEEHKHIQIPPGTFEVIQQREYDPAQVQHRRFVRD